MKKLFYAFSSLFFLIMTSFAQVEVKPAENPDIPELKEMHHVIYSMWHKAYPDKDFALLKSLYPNLHEQYRKLEDVTFPAEWPDREMHWKEALTKMNKTLQSYKKAGEEDDDQALLASARVLHDDFERLVRIVNPPIPEIDDFHKVLYHVYHDYLPEKNWEKIKESIPEFQEKMAAIIDITAPKWITDNADQFNEARRNLDQAVGNLSVLKKSNDEKQLEQAVQKLHEAYVKLESAME